MRRKGTAALPLLLIASGVLLAALGWELLGQGQGRQAGNLDELSAAEKEELAKKRERFERLSSAEQQRYRELHQELESHDDADRLTRVLLNYHTFLQSLTSIERAKLADLPLDERIAEIKVLKRRQDWRAFNRLAEKSVTPQDLEVLFNWIQDVAIDHEQELIDFFSQNEAFDRQRVPESERDRRRFWSGFLIGLLTEDPLQIPTDAEIERLGAELSPSAQAFLNSDSERQGKLLRLRGWLFVGWMSRRRNAISEEELEKFFAEQLNEDERHLLDQKSPEDRLDTLREMYVRRRMNRPPGRGVAPNGRGGGFAPRGGENGGNPPPPPAGSRPPSDPASGGGFPPPRAL